MGKGLRSVRRNRSRLSSGSKVGLSLLMAGAAFTPAIVMPADVVEASSPFAGGSGTELSPYEIETTSQLNQIRNYPDSHFVLKNDIDLTGLSWTPIPQFIGSLDGQGHTIKGLTLSEMTTDTGFFAVLKNATVSNLKFTDANVKTTSMNAGILVGSSIEGSTIDGVVVNGDVEGKGYVGGLVGKLESARVIKSYSSGTVKGNSGAAGAGGLIGYSARGVSIEKSYSTSDVEGYGNVGGLVGSVNNGDRVTQVYATGNVEGLSKGDVGGLIGRVHGGGRVTDAYATGDVTQERGDAVNSTGGLIGKLLSGENTRVKNVYAVGDVTGIGRVGGLIGNADVTTSSGVSVAGGLAINSKVISTVTENSGKFVGVVGGKFTANYKSEDTYTMISMVGGGHSKNVTGEKDAKQLRQEITYELIGFKFGNSGEAVWGIDEGETLPYLLFAPSKMAYNLETGKWKDVGGGNSEGDGTEGGEIEGDNSGSDGGGEGSEGGNNSSTTSSTADQNVQLKINAGDLYLDAPEIVDFGEVTLGDKAKVIGTQFTDSFKVTDARGTGEGWKLTVKATNFKEVEPTGGFKAGTGGYELPHGSLTITSEVAVEQLNGNKGILPSKELTSSVVIDAESPDSVLISQAGVDEGMGTFGYSYGEGALKLVVDPSTAKIDRDNYADVATPYESTVTWELVSGL